MDTYTNFRELNAAEREGIDFEICEVWREGASTVILAPHGGGIEPGTSEVAKQIAGDELSYAVFEGKKSKHNSRLHITSTNFDEPRCLTLVMRTDNVLAIHGEKSEEPIIFLGGRDAVVGARVREALTEAGYRVEVHKERNLQGISLANVCNRGRKHAGVQLELSVGLRRLLFASLSAEGRTRPADELFRLTSAIRNGLRVAGVL